MDAIGPTKHAARGAQGRDLTAQLAVPVVFGLARLFQAVREPPLALDALGLLPRLLVSAPSGVLGLYDTRLESAQPQTRPHPADQRKRGDPRKRVDDLSCFQGTPTTRIGSPYAP